MGVNGGMVLKIEKIGKIKNYTCGSKRWDDFENRKKVENRRVGRYCGAILWGFGWGGIGRDSTIPGIWDFPGFSKNLINPRKNLINPRIPGKIPANTQLR